MLSGVQQEVMLFAAIGLLLGGLDELAIDLLYLGRTLWRRATVYRRHDAMTTRTLPPPATAGRMAIFVPAWNEADVIGPMLWSALRAWGPGDYRIFVGVYPNDPDTIAAVASLAEDEPRIVMAIHSRQGPTTKADCLNLLWRAMLRDEKAERARFKAIVLHDAEDVVHEDALRLLDRMCDRFDLVQLPVLPLPSQQSQWVAGHYCDEFAESHTKNLIVREALGAAVPSAGVGCAFRRDALARLAEEQSGRPFDPHSLTEDYEIGLRLAERGCSSVFVRMMDAQGQPVCTREHFPERLEDAVRQKTRWTIGISLAGWDRLGWHGGFTERWMRLRDRRAALSALVLGAAYLGGVGWMLLMGIGWLGGPEPLPPHPSLSPLLTITAVLMLWRMLMRACFVTHAYGWRQGLRSIPRIAIGNVIAMLAARRALFRYAAMLRGAPLQWDKTTHRFPAYVMDGAR